MSVDASSAHPISLQELTGLLQKLPAHYHWAFADENLLRSIPTGMPVKRGSRGRPLYGLVRAASSIGLHWPLLWLVGVVELGRLLLRQLNVPVQSTATLQSPFRIFTGFGAGSEESLFSRYCGEHPGPVLRLDQTRIESFAQWHRVDISGALSALASAIVTARQAMKLLPADLGRWHCDFLAFIGMRIADYAYMRAWFGWLKNSNGANVEEVAFLAADTCAFAVADLELRPAYLQHGLIFYYLLPGFVRVEALTFDEANYFRTVFPQTALVQAPHYPTLAIDELAELVLVASIYGEPDYMARINPFLQWASTANLNVCVRPHPREDRRFWQGRGFDSSLVMDDSDSDFVQALQRLKPRLVISWFSTALAEALNLGVVPVTVCRPDDRAVADMPYLIFQRCLHWPQDSAAIARLLYDNDYYAAVLASLRKEIKVSQ